MYGRRINVQQYTNGGCFDIETLNGPTTLPSPTPPSQQGKYERTALLQTVNQILNSIQDGKNYKTLENWHRMLF